MVPEDLKYSREHEWLRMEGDTATIGITDHAQEEMGDLVFVELPAEGDSLATGKVLGTVESVKAVSELFAPVDGEVVAVKLGTTSAIIPNLDFIESSVRKLEF